MKFDVAIAGGGPAGATLGCLLRKYDPTISVLIVERERFPRDHVGESQLPAVCEVLDEIGAWDKVEAAGFPIKIGATYRWGLTDDFWDFNFILGADYVDSPRPGKYEGQRRQTAFQVDRSVYDKILLDHAREVGCTVMEGVKVVTVGRSGDKVTGFHLDDGTVVTAEYYCDCTGGSLMRRTMDVGIDSPTSLRNVAVWDYWQNADWAVNIGTGGTRIQVMSLKWGWLWFIPIGPTRTSIGLVTPTEYLRDSGKRLEDLYHEAVRAEPLVSKLIENAACENRVSTTKDWSFYAERFSGENWFLAGDSGGFADPILSAGMTLAQTGARRLAFTILELRKGEKNPVWLIREYNDSYKQQVLNHIRFADYWYSANAVFTDLKENCSKIAADAGLTLSADDAFQWLGTGGFARDSSPGIARAAQWNLGMIKHIVDRFSGESTTWFIGKYNTFRLKLDGTEKEYTALYDQGQVMPIRCYKRGSSLLPLQGLFQAVFEVLQHHRDLREIADALWGIALRWPEGGSPQSVFAQEMEALEAMICEGWVEASVNEKRPFLQVEFADEGYSMSFVEHAST